MIMGAILVLVLQLSGSKPLGLWPGVWGLMLCLALYILVSLLTRAPKEKAEEFVNYLKEALPKGKFI
jgi:SSS family solute:Na+ symporter